MEPALIDKIWGIFATFGNYKIGAEIVGGSFEVSKGKLGEGRDSGGGNRVGSPGERRVEKRRVLGTVVLLLLLMMMMTMVMGFFGVGLRLKRGRTATHD